MCTLHHFSVQYMCALYPGRCMQNDIKQLTSLSTFAFTFIVRFWPRGITFPSLYLFNVLSAIYTHIQPKFQKSSKYVWVFYPHSIFMLPICIFGTVLVPLDLYKLYGLIPELFDFLVHNVYQMYLESVFLLHLNHIPINNMIIMRCILLKK